MLGRPFAVLSTQAHGRGVGHRLVVPTVNLADYRGLLPSFGVYVTRIRIGERCFQAVTNVGNRPTFAGAGFSVESYILDFEPVEMNEATPVALEFLYRLRGEQTWPSPEALKAQIMKDVAIHLSHGRRRERAVDGAKAALIDGANLVAENIAVLGRTPLPLVDKHIDRGRALNVCRIGERNHDRGRRKAIAHIVLDHDAWPRPALFVPDDRIECNLDDHAAKRLADHQSPSRSTGANSSAMARFMLAFAV
jgi:hypothetical protein